jgi:ATP-dependent DNA helicase DinG
MTIERTYANITANITDFKARPSQLEMVKVISQCFSNIKDDLKDGHNLCLIEAPTGTGKSLAYLMAGVTEATKVGKKLVIATATKTLQGQLSSKDIPLFIKASGIKIKYGLAKGRSNYLCPYQLENSMTDVAGDMVAQADNSAEKLTKIATAFSSGWDGDLDNAPVMIENKLKPLITVDKHQCLGYQCPHNQKDESRCPFYNNREYLKNCDLIVTNHSLLMADLDSGGGNVLPVKPESYFLCVDEAHNFPGYAINGFMGQFDLKQSIGLVNNAIKLITSPASNSYIVDDIQFCDNLVAKGQDLVDGMENFLQLLKINNSVFNNGILILNDYLNAAITQDVKDLFIVIAFNSAEFVDGMEKIQEKLKERIKNGGDYLAEANLVKLGFYLSAIAQIANTSNYLINQDNSRYNANVRWVEQIMSGGGEDFKITSGVTHVGNLLINKLWNRVYGACLTSATLAVGTSFEYIKFQMGLNLLPKVVTVKLPSSFDYKNQSQLVIPRFQYAPEFNMREMFQKELGIYLGQILNYSDPYGTLVLFFNRQQLIDSFKQLPVKLQNRVLLQTEFSSNQKLIAEHKETIDSGIPSIIFGLNSFAEGVDLPSRYCMHVVITKLPFETHKDPESMVREYWVKAENGNYFMDVSLPEAGIKLIQAVGRLLRNESDHGQVTICDNRIVLKQYGGLLLKALPEFSRNYNPEFIKQALAVSGN